MSDDILIVDDVDFNITPAQIPPHRQRKSTAGGRKTQHLWTDDEIYRLIATVEQHRGLWDFSSPAYKLTKRDEWQIVVDELKIDGVDVNKAKVKWSSLRTTFMVNLAKLRKKKSGQGANESHTIAWKFFKSMLFLENNNLQNSTSSTSTLHLESADIDRSIVEEFSLPSPPSSSEFAVGNQRKRSRLRTPTLTSPPSLSAGSCSSHAMSLLNSGVAALHSSDTNSTFCDNLLAELRTLSEPRAKTLRYKLSRFMMDFMEASQEPIQKSQVQNENAFAQPLPLHPSELPSIGNNDEELYKKMFNVVSLSYTTYKIYY